MSQDQDAAIAIQIASDKSEYTTYVTCRLTTDASFKSGWDAYQKGQPWSRHWSRAEIAGWIAAKSAAPKRRNRKVQFR